MKSYIIFPLVASGLLLGAAMTSCGDGALKEYPWAQDIQGDTNEGASDKPVPPTSLEVIEKTFRGAIPFMINYSHEPTGTWAPHKYQYYRANSIDNYAGYFTTTKSTFTFGGPLPVLYTPDNDYLSGPMDNQVFTYCWEALNYADQFGAPEWTAIAMIVEAYAAHEMVDFYGAIPFTAWRNRDTTPPLTWESGEEIYNTIFNELDEAIKILNETQPSADKLARIEDQTKTVSDGDWRRWVKFANSIRLRMAMNIVDYDDALAQEQAEKAIADPIGPLVPGDRNFGYQAVGERTCCLYFMQHTWGDQRLGASYENIMKRLNHPLFNKLFSNSGSVIRDKTSGVEAPAGIYGIRAGIKLENLTAIEKGYGPFGWLTDNLKNMDQDFFKVEEVLFLRAEGALRGWEMGGTAQQFYEDGIRYFFQDMCRYEGITADQEAIDAYVNNNEVLDIDYIDYLDRDNDMEGRVNVAVKWDDSESNETKLEKIITQKYIANWPMSGEAWTTFRRTGYPRLFPVPDANNNFDGVETELQIRRCPIKQTVNNTAEIQQLTELLGGDQGAGVHVFWDKGYERWNLSDRPGEGGNQYDPVNF